MCDFIYCQKPIGGPHTHIHPAKNQTSAFAQFTSGIPGPRPHPNNDFKGIEGRNAYYYYLRKTAQFKIYRITIAADGAPSVNITATLGPPVDFLYNYNPYTDSSDVHYDLASAGNIAKVFGGENQEMVARAKSGQIKLDAADNVVPPSREILANLNAGIDQGRRFTQDWCLRQTGKDRGGLKDADISAISNDLFPIWSTERNRRNSIGSLSYCWLTGIESRTTRYLNDTHANLGWGPPHVQDMSVRGNNCGYAPRRVHAGLRNQTDCNAKYGTFMVPRGPELQNCMFEIEHTTPFGVAVGRGLLQVGAAVSTALRGGSPIVYEDSLRVPNQVKSNGVFSIIIENTPFDFT